jgi:jumonji domain-containing protein 7
MRIPVVQAKDLKSSDEFMQLCAPISDFSYRLPVLIKGGCSHWPAFHKWQSNEYLLSQMRDNQIKVSVTPDGYADAVKLMNDYRQKIFTFPLECEMPFNLFLTELQRQTLQSKRILYMQSQCDNLTGEQWRPLLDDLPLKSTGEMFGGWIVDCEQQQQQVFKQPPVARNIWIGREESVTSLHKGLLLFIYAIICK